MLSIQQEKKFTMKKDLKVEVGKGESYSGE